MHLLTWQQYIEIWKHLFPLGLKYSPVNEVYVGFNYVKQIHRSTSDCTCYVQVHKWKYSYTVQVLVCDNRYCDHAVGTVKGHSVVVWVYMSTTWRISRNQQNDRNWRKTDLLQKISAKVGRKQRRRRNKETKRVQLSAQLHLLLLCSPGFCCTTSIPAEEQDSRVQEVESRRV